MTHAAWEPVLAALEAHVCDLEAVAADPRELDRFGDAGVPAFEPPADLGPVPIALRTRAMALSVRMVEVELALTSALDAVRQDLHATERLAAVADGGVPAAPIYLDTRA